MRNLDSNFNSKTISPRYADRLPGGEMVVTDSGYSESRSALAPPQPAAPALERPVAPL